MQKVSNILYDAKHDTVDIPGAVDQFCVTCICIFNLQRVKTGVPQINGVFFLVVVFPLFVIGTTLYIGMSALPFGKVLTFLLTKKTTMVTVLCRHAHSD